MTETTTSKVKKMTNGTALNLTRWFAGVGGFLTGAILGTLLLHVIQTGIHQPPDVKKAAMQNEINLYWHRVISPALRDSERRIIERITLSIDAAMNGKGKGG